MGRIISNSISNFNVSSVIGSYVDVPFFEEVDFIPNYSDGISPAFPDVCYSPSAGNIITFGNISVFPYIQANNSQSFDYFKVGNIILGVNISSYYPTYNNFIYSNNDGETWTASDGNPQFSNYTSLNCFSADSSKFVTIQTDSFFKNKCLTSTDGLSWIVNPNVDDFSGLIRSSLIYNGQVFCVLSGSSVFVSSTGSGSWTQIGVPSTPNGVGFVHGSTIGYINSDWLIYSTDNGSTWTKVSNFPIGFTPAMLSSGYNKNFYMSDGNIFLLYFTRYILYNDTPYYENVLYSTTDFLNWTRRLDCGNYSSPGSYDSIGMLDGNFCMMLSQYYQNFYGRYIFLFSKDGIRWYKRFLSTGQSYMSMFLNSCFKTNGNLIRVVQSGKNYTFYPDSRATGIVSHV